MFRFEKLEVWKEARILVKTVYVLTANFPAQEKYGLTDQIRRAVVSIILNITEGSDRKSDIEFKRFLRMAITSAEEVVTGFYLAIDLEYVKQNEFDKIYTEINNLVARINALVRSLN
jgi:four helix bundle protein